MKNVRLLSALFVGVALMTGVAQADTSLYETLHGYYDGAARPSLERADGDSFLAGKCVYSTAPNQATGGVINVYTVGGNDPVSGKSTYMMVHVSPKNESDSYYLNFTKDQALAMHSQVASDLNQWGAVAENNDPLVNALTFSYREQRPLGRVFGADYTLREASNERGQKFYVAAARCPFDACGNLRKGDIFMMCYVWDKKI